MLLLIVSMIERTHEAAHLHSPAQGYAGDGRYAAQNGGWMATI